MKLQILVFALLAATGSSCSPANKPADWTVSPRQAGPVRIGMSLPEVRQALHDPNASLKGNAPGADSNECAYLQSSAVPPNMGLMFSNGQVVRIDVFEGGTRTAAGAAIGDTESQVKQLYPGQITVGPHKYVPEGHYLSYSPEDDGYGILFETDGAKVTSFRAGTISAISLVEGCS